MRGGSEASCWNSSLEKMWEGPHAQMLERTHFLLFVIIEIISKGCEDCMMIIIHKRTQHVVWHMAELNRH